MIWQRLAQARAFLAGRDYVTPDDVQDVAEPVLAYVSPVAANKGIDRVLAAFALVRAAEPDVAVLADGFSCRTLLRQAGTREPVHLARLAARALGLSAREHADGDVTLPESGG